VNRDASVTTCTSIARIRFDSSFFERWTDRDALHAHFKAPGTATFIEDLRRFDAAAGRPDVYEVTVPVG